MSRFVPRPQSTSFFKKGFGSTVDNGGRDLDEWLESTLKRELKLDSIERDDDGDIVLVSGSAVVYVSTRDDGTPWIGVFSPLLEDFAMRPEVYEGLAPV
ncbi:T3SS (YopN, CesT) and YbjN peptide-binding chaperone 1 [Mycobacterium sp. smrl_JER01]|uniref:T3SS (YopN, CesT) and YbjN peptide-binding chaperone 1 n=1 Tax=Mycobacterium sp. smrl_JER01 TaxID=3402633 RepID=UPI003ACDFCB5